MPYQDEPFPVRAGPVFQHRGGHLTCSASVPGEKNIYFTLAFWVRDKLRIVLQREHCLPPLSSSVTEHIQADLIRRYSAVLIAGHMACNAYSPRIQHGVWINARKMRESSPVVGMTYAWIFCGSRR